MIFRIKICKNVRMAITYFNELRVISEEINSQTIGSPHRIDALDSSGNLHRLTMLDLFHDHLRAQSNLTNAVYRIPLDAFSQAQITRLQEIFNQIDDSMDIDTTIDNNMYSHFRTNNISQNQNWQGLLNVVGNESDNFNWGINSPDPVPPPPSPPQQRPIIDYIDAAMTRERDSFHDPVKCTLSLSSFKRLCGV